MLTHNNFIANGINLTSAWLITERDRFCWHCHYFNVHAPGQWRDDLVDHRMQDAVAERF